jgi:hypothetical protein
VRNTQRLKPNATRSTTETLLYAVDTAEPGNESVTAMWNNTRCVRCAKQRDGSYLLKRYTTRPLSLMEVHTQGII